MSSNKAKRHTHKYYRLIMGFGEVWACALPDCNHYMPQAMEAMVNGKYSICWECGEQMIMHPGNMDMKQPICDSCKLGEATEILDRIENPLRKIG